MGFATECHLYAAIGRCVVSKVAQAYAKRVARILRHQRWRWQHAHCGLQNAGRRLYMEHSGHSCLKHRGQCGERSNVKAPSGEIWLAYRQVVQNGSTYEIQLNVRRSLDGGHTWSDLPGGLIGSSTASSFKGLWEPHLDMINGTIAVLYADDSPAAVGTTGLQNLYMKTWNGSGWGGRITVSDGVAAGSRDGMPVITQMNDGRYITVFEASDVAGHPLSSNIKFRRTASIGRFPVKRCTCPAAMAKAGAPFVVKLADGRLMVAFQTDEAAPTRGSFLIDVYDDQLR